MVTISDPVNKSFDSGATSGEGEETNHELSELVKNLMDRGHPDNRRPIPSYWDKRIKTQLAEYCNKTGVKFCEALEAAALLFMTLHPSDRVNVILNVVQVVKPSREEIAQIKNELEKKLMGVPARTRSPSNSPNDLIPVQCKCTPPVRQQFSMRAYQKKERNICGICRNPFERIPPVLLANTPHFYCPDHPAKVIIAPPEGDPPDCLSCGQPMTLIFQAPIDTAKRKTPPPKRSDRLEDETKQTTLEEVTEPNGNDETDGTDLRPSTPRPSGRAARTGTAEAVPESERSDPHSHPRPAARGADVVETCETEEPP